MRRLSICLVLISSFLLLPHPNLAQEPLARDPQAVALLQQSFLAMGASNLSAVRDTQATIQGTVLSGGELAPFTATLRTMGATRFRWDSDSAQGHGTLVVTERGALLKKGSDVPKRVPRMSVAAGGVTHLPLLSALAEWPKTGVGLEYVGLETDDLGSFHHIRLKRRVHVGQDADEDLPPCEIYLNAQTLLLAKLTYPMHAPDNLRMSEPVTVTYSDYRPAAGLMIPFHATYKLRGLVIREYDVSNFAVNQGVTDAEFDLR